MGTFAHVINTPPDIKYTWDRSTIIYSRHIHSTAVDTCAHRVPI